MSHQKQSKCYLTVLRLWFILGKVEGLPMTKHTLGV